MTSPLRTRTRVDELTFGDGDGVGSGDGVGVDGKAMTLTRASSVGGVSALVAMKPTVPASRAMTTRGSRRIERKGITDRSRPKS